MLRLVGGHDLKATRAQPPRQYRWRQIVSNGPRYDRAAAAAAEIVNLHLGKDQPKVEVFSRILFIILESMYAAERELNARRFEPSDN